MSSLFDKQRRILAYLDELPPYGGLRSERVNKLPAQALLGWRLHPLTGDFTLQMKIKEKEKL